MTSKTKRLLQSVLIAMLAIVSMCFFAACSGDKEPNPDDTPVSTTPSVTFMVQNDEGQWQQYGNTVEAAENGTITMPTNPTKVYYTFVSWYETEDFADGTQFKNEGITTAKTVYARFSANEVQVYINGEDQGMQKIVDVVSGSYNPGEGLEFDGWYTDENCQVKYENTDDTSKLYAQSVAKITFDNGYEVVYETKVLPNTVMKNPANDIIVNEDKSETTVQVANIVKFYMDSDNIFYVDADGNDIDFTQPITKSITIHVEWQSPGLAFIENPGTGNLATRMWNASTKNGGNTYATVKDVIASWPCIRIPDRTWYGENEERALRTVDCVSSAQNLAAATGATKIIFADGIQSIQSVVAGGTLISEVANVTEVVLPKNLKLIQDSFNSFPNVTFTIPDGVEVIINSFWKTSNTNGTKRGETYVDMNKGTGINYRGQRYGHSYDIAIPDSVINLSQVPTNFTFGENSVFYKDEQNRIYKKDSRGLVLICDYNVSEDGTLEIPEGVVGIQVGAFFDMPWIVTLKLPQSWNYISFNEDVKNYPFYYYRDADSTSSTNCWLYDETLKDNLSGLNKSATQIYDNFEGKRYGSLSYEGASYKVDAVFESVLVNNVAMPEGVWANIFGADYTKDAYFGKVCFVGTAPTGNNVTVYLKLINTQLNSSSVVKLTLASGSSFTMNDLLAQANIAADKAVTSVTQFGETYSFEGSVTSHLYLDVAYEFNPCGFDYEVNGNEITITKFNETKAGILDDGYLLVNIPGEIDGKLVTEIAANAFKDNESIKYVFIPSTVKKIGDSAFENCTNLKSLSIAYGNLEHIGAHAFEDTALTTIAIRTDKLTYVGPYAFKIQKLKYIYALFEDGNYGSEELGENPVANKYYAQGTTLIQYIKTSTEKQYNYDHSAQVDVEVIDAKLIAISPNTKISRSWGMGESGRTTTSVIWQTNNVVRWELMEGSVYYLNLDKGSISNPKKPIAFGIISKVHKNAFTDMDNEYFLTVTKSTVTDANGTATTVKKSQFCFYYGQNEEMDREDCWVTEQQVKTMDSAIFEEGWWEGWTSETDAENYQKLVEAMAAAYLLPGSAVIPAYCFIA